jgi:uncharacterized membrane protein
MTEVMLSEEAERSSSQLVLAIYILIAVSVFTAMCTGIIGVIIAHIKRDEARGSWLESHFDWLIQTFWYSIGGYALAGLLALTIIGIPLAGLLVVATWLWSVYRLVKGFLQWNERKAVLA